MDHEQGQDSTTPPSFPALPLLRIPTPARTPDHLIGRPLRSSTPTPRSSNDNELEYDIEVSDISSLSPVPSINELELQMEIDRVGRDGEGVDTEDSIIISTSPEFRRTRGRNLFGGPIPHEIRPRVVEEFEVASIYDFHENPIEDSDSTSSSSDMDSAQALSFRRHSKLFDSMQRLEVENFGDRDSSDSEHSSGSKSSASSKSKGAFSSDSELSEKDHWYCTKCNAKTNNPYLRYCLRCFRIRRDWLPKRPKTKKKPKEPETGVNFNEAFYRGSSNPSLDLTSSNNDTTTAMAGAGPSHDQNIIGNSQDLEIESQAESKYPTNLLDIIDAPPIKVAKTDGSEVKLNSLSEADSLCAICMVRDKNAAFIHGKTAHMYSCYTCGDKILKKSGKCPICRKRILRVVKIIVA